MNYYPYNYNMVRYPRNIRGRNGERFGGFVVPFLLGGIAGSLWNQNQRPYGYNYYYGFLYPPYTSYPFYYQPPFYH